MAKQKQAEPEITADGIKIDLGGGYWILYSKVWDISDEETFKRASNLDALKMVIEHALDWNVPNSQWEPIPFDRDALIAAIDKATWGEVSPGEMDAAVGAMNAALQLDLMDEFRKEFEVFRALNQKLKSTRSANAVPRIPIQLQTPLIASWWKAMGAARTLPFPSVLDAGGRL